MKKVYSLIAIATLMVCAAACGNNANKAKDAEEPKTEAPAAPAKEKSAEDQVKEAVTNAAVDVTKEAANAAANAAKDALNK